MARRTTTPPPDVPEKIVDIDVAEEMRGSFLEYAYSVIYSRALPDARDGLKPVQRRILFGMSEMGLRPDRGHVKSARVVGDVMGKYHPHGDGAIYDALVRMAQPFSLRLPLVDGHGNFGSLDDGPAAMRYTECRLAQSALLLTTSLDEDVVDFAPNYDGRENEPTVLPAAFPNLLVNGASGIAVGMATNIAPHNLVEVVAAARHLLAHPRATLDDLMQFVPGPDLPGGGRIIGLDGIREAYETGRGAFRVRATAHVENVTPRRKGVVVTELPVNVGPEKVITRIKEAVDAKKLPGHRRRRRLLGHGVRAAPGHRDQERFPPRGGARAALHAHADGGLVQHQRRRARRRPAAHPRPARPALGVRRAPPRRRTPSHDLPPPQGRGPPAPRARPPGRDPRHRRGHRAHPLVRRLGGGEDAAHAGLRPQRRPGHLHPRHAAAPPHQVQQDRARERARRAADADRRADRDPRRRQEAAPRRERRARRRRQGARHAATHGAARVGRSAHAHSRPARGRRRPVRRAAVEHRPARAHGGRPRPARRRRALRARRRRLGGARHRPRPGRPGHQRRARPAPAGARAAHAALHPRCAVARWRRAPRGAHRARQGRAAGGPVLAVRRGPGPRARHRRRRREARVAGRAVVGRLLERHPARRRRPRRRRRGARPPATRSSSSSRPTRSCCASPRRRCVRRVVPPAAWRASVSATASAWCSSARSTPSASPSWSPPPARAARCPAPRAPRSR